MNPVFKFFIFAILLFLILQVTVTESEIQNTKEENTQPHEKETKQKENVDNNEETTSKQSKEKSTKKEKNKTDESAKKKGSKKKSSNKEMKNIGQEELDALPNPIIEAEHETFDRLVRAADLSLVLFYTDEGCEKCLLAKKEAERAAKLMQLRNLQVAVFQVDGTKEPELTEKYGVTEFPSIKIFKIGGFVSGEYKGAIDADTMAKHMEGVSSAPKCCRNIGEVQQILKGSTVVLGKFV